jgi:anhydro-N-acetylmuramic acid kinase
MAEPTQSMILAVGLMSGTSLDGIDAALVRTDGISIDALGEALTISYPPQIREELRAILGSDQPSAKVASIERKLTLLHADAVRRLLNEAGLAPPDIGLVGFHGHTILHRPSNGRTWQIGDGALLAHETGIAVVNDFRTADVAAGGQGAPLVPLFHAAMAGTVRDPLAVLNLGGVGNVTWIGRDGALLAFDTGPGNALIDDWAMRHIGFPVDKDGRLAHAGRIDAKAMSAFAAHPYFREPPPKSLDRDDFKSFADGLVRHLSPEDGAATLSAFTGLACALAQSHFPEAPARWLVCGGGRRNPVLMGSLRGQIQAPVEPVEAVGWDGDALEAQAFGFLGVRSYRGLPTSVPGTTGAAHPILGGTLHRP